jgi:hypothetical protein
MKSKGCNGVVWVYGQVGHPKQCRVPSLGLTKVRR